MVQKLARLAIQRERVRLARELHDDIAPSIASVGLALDMMLLSDDIDVEQRRNLDATRSNVTRLVESIRNRVQDLRADRTMSLVEVAHSLVAEVDTDGPTVIVDIDERTPPRPAIAMEISSLITEAFRNAVSHSGGSLIRVTGRIVETDGWIAVEDNGVGFDADQPPLGRYGLIGMRERAGLIGAELEVHSQKGAGTTVTITWRNSR
jgi:signal transduction histidine kinase